MSAADIIAVGSNGNAPTSGKVCTRHGWIKAPQNQPTRRSLAQTGFAGRIVCSRSLGGELNPDRPS